VVEELAPPIAMEGCTARMLDLIAEASAKG
jgi:hypothetical protein